MKSQNIKTAVILCGGKGTRLGHLGKKLPKCLVKVHDNLLFGHNEDIN